MLHHLTKVLSTYVASASKRKNINLDSQNFTAEIKITSTNDGGETVTVVNTIAIAEGLPKTYSELVSNNAGQTISFIAGASSNKRKQEKEKEQDKLVELWKEVKPGAAIEPVTVQDCGSDVVAVNINSVETDLPEPVAESVPAEKKVKTTKTRKAKNG